jgi:formylglycine-generating enzyme
MRSFSSFLAVLVTTLPLTSAREARGDRFGEGDSAFAFEIEFVPIGAPGNPPDALPNPAGAVSYPFRMGKYEVSTQMIFVANALGNLGISYDQRDFAKPATGVSWYEAARFVNWLNTSTGHPPAYRFDANGAFQLWRPTDPGYDPANAFRNRGARYFLPGRDEWHKAAYYDPVAERYWTYPTGSDAIPDGIDFPGDPDFDAVFFDGGNNLEPNDVTNVGVLSPFGTAGQGGNVHEWLETPFDRVIDLPDDHRFARGGGAGSPHTAMLASNNGIGWTPTFENGGWGFRVAAVPEPCSGGLSALALVGVCARRVRRPSDVC